VQVSAERDRLLAALTAFRRSVLPELVVAFVRAAGEGDLSIVQVGTLYVLDTAGEPTLKQVAEATGRSLSAASRMVDQLVARGFAVRREDDRDRRAKRVQITAAGRAVLRTFEQERANVQLAVMEHLSADERDVVNQAMALLAEGARRRRDAR
jgi:DNA-binding MarR family transcriptional regulator